MSGGYGADGLIGICTPQGNPTVEAEMAILLPPTVLRVTTRLTSRAADPSERLRAYLEGLSDALATFDVLRPAAVGFACTGSTYLLGATRAAAIVREAEERFGIPVITAAAAVAKMLRSMNAQRIALVSPYPLALTEAACRHWAAEGFTIAHVAQIDTGDDDTRSIYRLGADRPRRAIDALRGIDVDAVLVSGTGLPSLPLLADPPDGAPPVLSSNLALAQCLAEKLGLGPLDWHARLAAAIPPSIGSNA